MLQSNVPSGLIFFWLKEAVALAFSGPGSLGLGLVHWPLVEHLAGGCPKAMGSSCDHGKRKPPHPTSLEPRRNPANNPASDSAAKGLELQNLVNMAFLIVAHAPTA